MKVKQGSKDEEPSESGENKVEVKESKEDAYEEDDEDPTRATMTAIRR